MFPANTVNGGVELIGSADDFNHDNTFRISLSMSRQIRVYFGSLHERSLRDNIPEIFHITNSDQTRRFSFQDPTAVFARSNWPVPSLSLGVGPGSHFIEQAESISIVRDVANTTSALVGMGLSDYEFVTQACVPGSAFRTALNGDDCIEFVISLRGESSGYDHSPYGLYETCFGLESTPRLDPGNFMTIPYTLASNLTRRVRQWGANRNENGVGFTECDSSILPHLPEIVISFFANSHRVVGSIVFLPEDYLSIDERTETCHFKFRSINPSTESMFIDPLRLPHISVHIAQSDIMFCDPL